MARTFRERDTGHTGRRRQAGVPPHSVLYNHLKVLLPLHNGRCTMLYAQIFKYRGSNVSRSKCQSQWFEIFSHILVGQGRGSAARAWQSALVMHTAFYGKPPVGTLYRLL